MQQEIEARQREEVQRLCREFRKGLAAVRGAVESAGGDSDAFFASTALFDGPTPPPLRDTAFGSEIRMHPSRNLLLQSVPLPKDPRICELGVWKGSFSKILLKHLSPRELHLYDLDFSKLDPAVRAHPATILHEGDSGTLLAELPDESLHFAYVDGDHSYRGARRDLFGIFDKVVPGGFIQLNDYTPWSVLSGFPYGVMASVHELLNEGGARIVGLGLHAFGHHDLLLQKNPR